jgi:hypothetical protein
MITTEACDHRSSRSRFRISRLSGFRQAMCLAENTPKTVVDRVDQVVTTEMIQKGF